MIKIRLKRYGRKKQPTYRLVVMNSSNRRDGRAIEEVGFYNPMNNVINLNIPRISARLAQGVQLTDTVRNILKKANVL